MFDRLPEELNLKVSNHLYFKDKLALSRACRRIHDVISGSTLYLELDLFERLVYIIFIVEWFKSNDRSLGKQVKLLQINIGLLPHWLLSQLFIAFLNVTRVITFEPSSRYVPRYEDFSPQGENPMLRWANTLETYNTCRNWSYIILVLKTIDFPQLKVLKIRYKDLLDSLRDSFNFSCFIPSKRNASALKKLTLTAYPIDLESLDEINFR